MELIFEFIGEICFGILGSIIESDRVPKWMRYTLIGLLISGPIALCVSIMIRNQDIVTTILMCLIILAIIGLFAAAVHTVYRSGILRPVKEEDVPEVLKMYCSVIGKPGCNWSISYPNEATLQEDFRAGNLYVLWRGNKMIGAGSIVPKNELDDLDVWQHWEKVGEIARIVIKPEYQSKGYGKHLVKKLCYKLDEKGHTAVHLLVSTENHHALNLYRETGFHCMGQCERYDHTYYAFEKKL